MKKLHNTFIPQISQTKCDANSEQSSKSPKNVSFNDNKVSSIEYILITERNSLVARCCSSE